MKKQVIAFLAGIALTICVSTTMPRTAREVTVKIYPAYSDSKVQRYIKTMSAEGWRLTALTPYATSSSPVSSFMVVMERNQ